MKTLTVLALAVAFTALGSDEATNFSINVTSKVRPSSDLATFGNSLGQFKGARVLLLGSTNSAEIVMLKDAVFMALTNAGWNVLLKPRIPENSKGVDFCGIQVWRSPKDPASSDKDDRVITRAAETLAVELGKLGVLTRYSFGFPAAALESEYKDWDAIRWGTIVVWIGDSPKYEESKMLESRLKNVLP